jgi:hypothetical protein
VLLDAGEVTAAADIAEAALARAADDPVKETIALCAGSFAASRLIVGDR